MDAITNALKHSRLAVVFEMKIENNSTMAGPAASRPNFTGFSASLCIFYTTEE